jgi:hypothetical protein
VAERHQTFRHVGFFRPLPWGGMPATAGASPAAVTFSLRIETVTIGFLFWVLMILWLVFGLYWNRGDIRGGNYGLLGGNLLMFTLLFLLGWKMFGFPIQG